MAKRPPDARKQANALRQIRADMEQDVKNLDGLPFNGKTVAEALGHLAAAVSALAGIMLSDLDEEG